MPTEPPDTRLSALVLATGVVAAAVTTRSTLPAHRWWGAIALAGYGLAALIALSPARRWWPLVAFVATGVVPLVVLVIGRSRGWHHVAQSEVDVLEAGARRLVHHGTPYLDPSAMSAAQRTTHYSYVPYLPPLTLAGVPRAIFGSSAVTDARLWLAVGDLVLWRVIWRRASGPARAALVLVACSPLVTLPMTVGGHDVLIASLLVLGGLGVVEALGGAAALTYLAWPLVLPLAPRPASTSARVRAGVILAVALVPLAVDPHAAYENLVLFPLGRTPARSPADAPSIGQLLGHLPGGRVVDLAALALCVGVLGWLTCFRPAPSTAVSLARGAVCFAVLIALVPSTRVGYLLYPVTFWALARTVGPDPNEPGTLRPKPATARPATRSRRPSAPARR